MLLHEAMLDLAEATRRLGAEEVRGWGALRLLGRQAPDRLRGVDLVLVPHWYCRFHVVIEGPMAGSVAADLWAMVDALDGEVLRLAGPPPLRERDLASLAPAVALPPAITEDAATLKAREALRWDVTARARLRATPRTVEPAETRLGHVPFWVGYYARADGGLRAVALHGLEGAVQGAAFTGALLRALQMAG